MKWMNALLWVGIASGSACSYQVDLDMKCAEARPVLYCFPSGKDTVWIQLSKSIPVKGEREEISVGEVQMLLNKQPLEVHCADQCLPAVPEGAYYTVAHFRAGDEVEVHAEVKDEPALYGKTVIPPDFPLQHLSMEQTADKRKLIFHVGLKDRDDEADYYGIHIQCYEQHWRGDLYSGRVMPVRCEIKNVPLLYEVAGLDEIFGVSDGQPYEYLYIFDDIRIMGKEYTLSLPADYKEDYQTGEEGKASFSKVVYHYQVNLYGLSEELFRYLKCLSEMEEGGLGEAGLAPRHPTYTNVTNGLGLVGACRLWQSGWMDNIGE